MKTILIASIILLNYVNISQSVPVKDNLTVDLNEISYFDNNPTLKDVCNTILDRRIAYTELIRSLKSYDFLFGEFEYNTLASVKELSLVVGINPFSYARNPIQTMSRLKRYEDRYLEFQEKYNKPTRYVDTTSGTEEMGYAKYEKEMKLLEGDRQIRLKNFMIEGKSKEVIDFFASTRPFEYIQDQPYAEEQRKLWDIANYDSLEVGLDGLRRGIAEVKRCELTNYNGRDAFLLSLYYPNYDGANTFIISLDERDYGQPIYIHRRSGCDHCEDLTKRTIIREMEVENISFEFLDNGYGDLLPIPSQIEVVEYKNNEIFQVRQYFLFAGSLNSIQAKDTLKVPFLDHALLDTTVELLEKDTVLLIRPNLAGYLDLQPPENRFTVFDSADQERMVEQKRKQGLSENVNYVLAQDKNYLYSAMPSSSSLYVMLFVASAISLGGYLRRRSRTS